jgi:predicted metal-dependent hydrolase
MEPAVTVRRSARARRARLHVTSEGEAVVTLPMRAPARWAAELVATRAAWLAKHQSRLLDERRRYAERPTLGVRPLLLGGYPHRLVVAPLSDGARRVRIEHDDALEPTLRLLLPHGDERPLGTILEPWLRGEARRALERRVATRAREVGVEVRGLRVGDQRSRWGSASRTHRLSFSWRLVLAPRAVLDYVVVHELAHLRDFSHSPAYWRIVREVVPEADEARRWLRAHESDLRHALD